jgi:muramoyltetrapeptide carboxypeptidase
MHYTRIVATPSTLKPAPLRRGDTVAIIAPASNVQRELLERGAAALRDGFGYKVVFAPSIFERDLYFAGKLNRRLAEFHAAFESEDVRAIVCARGGYGCNYLLDGIDLDLVRRHPKILIGCSDVTALLTYLHDATGLVTFHGPMAASGFASEAGAQWGGSPQGVHPAAWECAVGGWFGYDAAEEDVTTLVEGEAEGKLYGGCLSILVASLGTPYEIQTRETILLVEDVNTKPYQVDRMLMQLALAGKLEGVRGFVFGEMLDCVQPGGQDYTLQDVIVRVLAEHSPGVPVVFGFRSGHVSRHNITLPIGVHARLQAKPGDVRLTIVESAVEPAGTDAGALIANFQGASRRPARFDGNGGRGSVQ